MSEPILQRIDLYNDFPFAAGAQRIRPLLNVEKWDVDKKLDGLIWRRSSSVTLPIDTTILEEQALVFEYKTILGVTSQEAYRINGNELQVQAGKMTLLAEGPERDLTRRDQVIGELVGGVWNLSKVDAAKNISTCITDTVLPRLPSYWGLGTFASSTLISVSYQPGDTPGAALLRQVEALNKIDGLQYEVSVTANAGTGKFEINVTLVGQSAPTILALPNRSIIDMMRRQGAEGHGTRICPIGRNGATIGKNAWKVVTVNTPGPPKYIEVEDFDGGPGPAWESQQWLNNYVRRVNGTTEAITQVDVVSTQRTRFQMADVSNFSVGHRVKLVADATPNEVLYVESPAAIAQYGTILLPLILDEDDTENLLDNPDFLLGGTSPTGWTKTGGGVIAVDTTPGNWETAGLSIRLDTATIVLDQTKSIQVPGTGNWYANYLGRVKINPTAAPGTIQMGCFYDGSMISTGPVDLNQFTSGGFETAYLSWKLGSGSHTVGISFSMGRNMWLDDAMLYITKERGEQRPFLKGSGSSRMIQAANAKFRAGVGLLPAETIEVGYADLARLDPKNFFNLQLRDGGLFRLRYPPLGFDRTMRVLRRRTSSEAPGEPSITLQNRPGTFSDFYAVR